MTISWKGNAKHNHAGRDAELGKLTYIIGGNMNVFSIMENNMEVPQNTKNRTPTIQLSN